MMVLRILMVALAFASASVHAAEMTPREVYKKVGPAVVLILGSDDGRAGSGGTGSIITKDGKVITNAHVVINQAGQPYKMLYVFLKPDKLTGDNAKDLTNRYKARVLSYSRAEELDLAVLQIESAPANPPTINFADPDEVEIGEEVVAIGHPEQGGLWTLTTGTVSTLIANFNGIRGKDVFQTEASVNRGNSGGPLLDGFGNMVGINTMIARQAADGLTITDINFSLKSSVAVKWLAGQGLGLAYSAKPKSDGGAAQVDQPITVAVAPEPQSAAPAGEASGQAVEGTGAQVQSGSGTSSGTQVKKPTVLPTEPVSQAPAGTIVVVDDKPAKPEAVRSEGKTLGKDKQEQKLEGGQPLDAAKAKPKYVTKKRPYSIDELRKQQMKELEDMMDEMRGKGGKKKSGGMGLW